MPHPHSPPPAHVILPASNEAGYIGRCLDALAAQDAAAGALAVVVVANGCHDDTAAIARSHAPAFAARGWSLQVIERAEGGKIGALDAGDAAAAQAEAQGRADGVRIYLDADVVCTPALVGQLRAALARPDPAYATGRLQVAPARSWVTRRFAAFWVRLPFVAQGTTGAGLFAVNPAGRRRWGAFPQVISDDTFVRLQFRPDERHQVAAPYLWPMVEGARALIRVRRRQDIGVEEIRQRFPELMANEGKAPLRPRDLLGLAATAPVGFVVYMAVWLAARRRNGAEGWARGR